MNPNGFLQNLKFNNDDACIAIYIFIRSDAVVWHLIGRIVDLYKCF